MLRENIALRRKYDVGDDFTEEEIRRLLGVAAPQGAAELRQHEREFRELHEQLKQAEETIANYRATSESLEKEVNELRGFKGEAEELRGKLEKAKELQAKLEKANESQGGGDDSGEGEKGSDIPS